MATAAADLGRAIYEYDRSAAALLLGAIEQELGGKLDGVPADADSVTTSEWKEGLAQWERLRALGLELQRLLR